jgi:hypothetical protein
MSFRLMQTSLLTIGLAIPAASAQVPIEFGSLEPAAALSPALQNAVVTKAANYPFVGFRMLGRDSVLLVFEDSSLTVAGLRANTWMFGPPVTSAEADSCPPEKVLGRKIARAFWNAAGRPAETQVIMIAVRGTRGVDRWTAETMYYWRNQLEKPWAGDPTDP